MKLELGISSQKNRGYFKACVRPPLVAFLVGQPPRFFEHLDDIKDVFIQFTPFFTFLLNRYLRGKSRKFLADKNN
jgi:hypothetical protein